jgi:CRP-like cAMP-binding protein
MTHIFNEPAKQLFAYLEQFFEPSDAQKDQLLDKIAYVSLEAGEYLVKEGEVCANLYIVHTGQLRSFFFAENDNTKELIEVEVLSLRENDVCIPNQERR